MPKRRLAVLIRGINLGSRNKVPMPALREALAEAGFTEVQTLLQSGNVVVSSSKTALSVAKSVSAVISETFGVDVPCIAIDGEQLQAAVDACPWRDKVTDGRLLAVFFIDGEITPDLLTRWNPSDTDPNAAVGPRVVYQWMPQGFQEAPALLPRIERSWELTGSARNWNTVMKLLDMLAPR